MIDICNVMQRNAMGIAFGPLLCQLLGNPLALAELARQRSGSKLSYKPDS